MAWESVLWAWYCGARQKGNNTEIEYGLNSRLMFQVMEYRVAGGNVGRIIYPSDWVRSVMRPF